MNKYVVYILRTNKGTLYTGQTSNLENRLKQHRQGKGAKYMRAFEDFELVYQEKCESLSEALKKEWEIKKLSKRNKELLIEKQI
jgi:putative endonuclease